MKSLKKIISCILTLALLMPAQVNYAAGIEDDLVRISLDIFPKLVAVDLDLKDKLTSDSRILLQIFYQTEKELASSVVQKLQERYPRIAGHLVQVDAVSTFTKNSPTAILLVERMDDKTIREVIRYGISNHILIFSPFKEDVDRGVTAGMYMAVRILPYFNRVTLNRSKIKIHKILLRSAKYYE